MYKRQVAGLHDAVEETWMTCDEITREFGPEVALLVDGVTKIGQLSYSKDKVELQAESLRKMCIRDRHKAVSLRIDCFFLTYISDWSDEMNDIF